MTTPAKFALPAASIKPKALPVQAEVLGELTFADLEATPVFEAQELMVIKERHHAIARLLAKGEKAFVVAAATGYAPSYISMLQKDPTFQELLAHYQSVADASFRDTMEQMKIVRGEALSLIQDRLATNPDQFKTEDLLKISTSMLDRSGHGPTQKHENQNLMITGQDLLDLKEAARDDMKGEIINAETHNTQENQRSEMGKGGARSAVSDSKETEEGEAPGLASAGSDLREDSGPETSGDGTGAGGTPVVCVSRQQRKGVVRDGLLPAAAGGDTSDGVQAGADLLGVPPDAGAVCADPSLPVQKTSDVPPDLQVPKVRTKNGDRGARPDPGA